MLNESDSENHQPVLNSVKKEGHLQATATNFFAVQIAVPMQYIRLLHLSRKSRQIESLQK